MASAALFLVLAGAINWMDPAILLQVLPDCPFLELTGYQCPLCGSGRALSSLGRGEWKEALALNPLMVLALPALLLLGARWGSSTRGISIRGAAGRWLAFVASALLVGFWIWRNVSS